MSGFVDIIENNDPIQLAGLFTFSLATMTALGIVLLTVVYYLFFAPEIIREKRERRKVKAGLTLARNPSFEDLGLSILFEDVSKKIVDSDEEISESDEPDLPEFDNDDTLITNSARRGDSDVSLPSDMLAFLRSIRVFGYFEDPIFVELYRHSESIVVQEGDYLFRRGDNDHNFYVIVEGEVEILVDATVLVPDHNSGVFSPLQSSQEKIDIAAEDETLLRTAVLKNGDSVSSLFNVLAVLLYSDEDLPQRFIGSQVTARALKKCTLCRIPTSAFRQVSKSWPKAARHIIQVILTRFHRVTFLALNRVLGLTDEFLSGFSQSMASASASSDMNARDMEENHLLQLFSGLSAKQVEELLHSDPRLKPSTQRGEESSSQLAYVGDVEVLFVEADQQLICEGDRDMGMFFVLRGELDVYLKRYDDASGQHHSELLTHVKPGQCAGYLSLVTHYPSLLEIRASKASCLGYVSASMFDRYINGEHGFDIAAAIARRIMQTISPLAKQIDFALEWRHMNAGSVLYKAGQESNSIHFVLSGRLRAVLEKRDGAIENAGEFGQGDSVGQFSVFTDTSHDTTVYAIRDTELVGMPKALLQVLALKIPKVALQISRMTAKHSLQQLRFFQQPRPVCNISTVALLPITSDVPIYDFAEQLQSALTNVGPCLVLTKKIVSDHLGKTAFSRMAHLRLTSYFEEQEENHRIVLYVGDVDYTNWSGRCIRQADLLLLVGLAAHPQSKPTKLERQLLRHRTAARKELALLHVKGDWSNQQPSGTHVWLQERPWIYASHHIRMDVSASDDVAASDLAASVQSSTHTLEPTLSWDSKKFVRRNRLRRRSDIYATHNDFMRLARLLTGKAIGLVLGGGGARGLAHVGVIKALEEAGIPVDIIGGTSIGSLVGALYARDTNFHSVNGWMRRFSSMMSSKLTQLLDLTYPITSLFTGRSFNRIIRKTVGDVQSEYDELFTSL